MFSNRHLSTKDELVCDHNSAPNPEAYIVAGNMRQIISNYKSERQLLLLLPVIINICKVTTVIGSCACAYDSRLYLKNIIVTQFCRVICMTYCIIVRVPSCVCKYLCQRSTRDLCCSNIDFLSSKFTTVELFYYVSHKVSIFYDPGIFSITLHTRKLPIEPHENRLRVCSVYLRGFVEKSIVFQRQ